MPFRRRGFSKSGYGDAAWDLAGDLPPGFIEGDDSLDVELVYARRGRVRDAYEVYLQPDRVHHPVKRLNGLELMFRTVAPPEIDTNAARGIAWLLAAFDRAGLKYEREP